MRPRLIILQPTPYCNINCSYCYLTNRDDRALMSEAVLDAVRDRIIARLAKDSAPAIIWHAGEPTAAPISWYEKAYEKLSSVIPPKATFAMQSNGVAVDARWVDFFARTNTHVSLSIDGPQPIHDARRRTRNDKPTWSMAIRGLRLLQEAGLRPPVITVLHPTHLSESSEYFHFYKEHGVTEVSFSIDEREGGNGASSFSDLDKSVVSTFLVSLMDEAYRDNYPLHIREVERIAYLLAGAKGAGNEQVEPWASIVVAASGAVSTFSPEFMEVRAEEYGDFILGDILVDEIEEMNRRPGFVRLAADVESGVSACATNCRYFGICGGGSPVNKYCEQGNLGGIETEFCRLSTQAAADALNNFLTTRLEGQVAESSNSIPEIDGAQSEK